MYRLYCLQKGNAGKVPNKKCKLGGGTLYRQSVECRECFIKHNPLWTFPQCTVHTVQSQNCTPHQSPNLSCPTLAAWCWPLHRSVGAESSEEPDWTEQGISCSGTEYTLDTTVRHSTVLSSYWAVCDCELGAHPGHMLVTADIWDFPPLENQNH